MFQVNDTIDEKYKVTGLCSNSGGMGTILFVDALVENSPFQLVLKYCKESEQESIQRFCREIRYLNEFKGNSKIVQIYDSNLTHTPPYFVMKYYQDGDLTKVADRFQKDIEYQEEIFCRMIDCISELHLRGYQHRDIKPQNFLMENNSIIVSDFGLSKAIGAGTTFTMSHVYWGTYGYMPPEFVSDFREASPPSDIFMLGKSFYWLLTKREPLYLNDQGLHPAIFHIIEKCCHQSKDKRYQTLSELKQDLILAFDVALNRASGVDRAMQLLSQIQNRLSSENQYVDDEIKTFVDLLKMLDLDDKHSIIRELPSNFFIPLAQPQFEDRLAEFLKSYETFVQEAVQTFSYAEVVADNMKIVFDMSTSNQLKSKALEIGVKGAIWANRFAAMDTCKRMIYSIEDEDLGVLVSTIISSNANSFLKQLEPSQCQSNAIRVVVGNVKQRNK